jgi:hypothetical protein
MSPLDTLPFVMQAGVVAATFAVMLFVGRTGLLLLRCIDSLWATTFGSSKVVETDDSRRNIGVPDAYTGTKDQLHELAFFPLGAVRLAHPRRGAETIVHVFWSLDGLTTASFPRAPNRRVRFATWFEDGAVIVTDYPRGTPLTTDQIVSQVVGGSLEAAHAAHWQQVETWTAAGRAPAAIDGMQTYLDRQAAFRERFQKRYGNPYPAWLIGLLAATLAVTAGAVGIIVGLYAAQPGLVVLAILFTGAAEWGRGRLFASYRRLPGTADAR